MLKNNEKGSILILTLLALVGAMSIAIAMSTVSIIERKITTKSRKSVTAFQVANSGLEWAMKKINDAGPGKTVEEVFGLGSSSGEVSCPSNLFSDSQKSCTIILLTGSDGNRVKVSGDIPVEDVVAIRSRGHLGSGTEEVGRALEAYAMPNCGSEEERVADFCIDSSRHLNVIKWDEAVEGCEDAGKRLCSTSELVAAYKGNVLSNLSNEWTADMTSGTQAVYLNDARHFSEDNIANQHHYRCCRNR